MRFWDRLFRRGKKQAVPSDPVSETEVDEEFVKSMQAAQASLDHERLSHLFERAPSFSIVMFEGDVVAAIPRLLEQCGYKILRQGKISGSFDDAYARLSEFRGPNSPAYKAVYRIPAHTVLIEPTMVFVTYEQQLREFCRDQSTRAIVAAWERGSETALLGEFSAAGKLRITWYCQGQVNEVCNPHPALVNRPDNEGLKEAIKEYTDPAGLFGQVDCGVFELQWQKPSAAS